MRQSLSLDDRAIHSACGWLPDAWLPEAELRRALVAVARMPASRLLDYGPPLGYLPLRQQIAHAVLQSIRGLRFSRIHAALQHSLDASCWQSRAALAALGGTDLPQTAFFRGMDGAFSVADCSSRNLPLEIPCQTG